MNKQDFIDNLAITLIGQLCEKHLHMNQHPQRDMANISHKCYILAETTWVSREIALKIIDQNEPKTNSYMAGYRVMSDFMQSCAPDEDLMHESAKEAMGMVFSEILTAEQQAKVFDLFLAQKADDGK